MKDVIGPEITDFVVFATEINTRRVDEGIELKREIDLISTTTLEFTDGGRVEGVMRVRLGRER